MKLIKSGLLFSSIIWFGLLSLTQSVLNIRLILCEELSSIQFYFNALRMDID